MSEQLDAFDRLGVPPAFDIDPAAIERKWLVETAKSHPDRAPDPAEAAARMALLNGARATLLDDEQRANALLARLGGPAKEDDQSLPDGFLMEIFELREAMEGVVDSGNEERIDALRQDAAARRDVHRSRVAERFAALDHPASPQSLAEIRCELNAWRYIERMIEQLD